jgi:hypothetical protein
MASIQTYRLLQQLMYLTFAIGVIGVGAWALVTTKQSPVIPAELLNFHKFYAVAYPPELICTEKRIPAGTTVEVMLAGDWSQLPKPLNPPQPGYHDHIGPAGAARDPDWITYVIGKEFDGKKTIFYDQKYMHPNTFTHDKDFDVCVRLPSPEPNTRLIIDDNLDFKVRDQRLSQQ